MSDLINSFEINGCKRYPKTEVNFSLNRNWVSNTADSKAIAIYFKAPFTGSINKFYLFCSSLNGSSSSTTLTCQLRTRYAGGFTDFRIGLDILASTSTSNYSSLTSSGWIEFTFSSPYTVTKNKEYTFHVFNSSSSPTTNYPTIRISAFTKKGTSDAKLISYYTNNTWSNENSIFQSGPTPYLINIGDEYFGQPFTTVTNYGFASANSYQRGILVSNCASSFQWINVGAYNGDLTNLPVSKYRIFSVGDTPSSTPFLEIDAKSLDYSLYTFFPEKTFVTSSGPYKVVQTVSSATNFFPVAKIEDYSSFASIFQSLYDFQSLCPAVYEDGFGGWTTDYSLCPLISLGLSYKLDGLVTSNNGELQLLNKMIKDSLSINEDYFLKLYKNNYNPKSTSVASDFTEADFTNYSAKTLTRASWSSAATTDSCAVSTYASQSWTCGATGNTLYGYYVVGATSGTLLWAERFSVNRFISNNEVISITPKIALESGF